MSNFLNLNFISWGDRRDYCYQVNFLANHYAVNFELTGELELIINGKYYPVTAPAVWIAHPGNHIQVRKKPDSAVPWRHIFAAFRGEIADDWALRGLLDVDNIMPLRDPGAVSELYARLFRTLSRGPNDRSTLALLELFIHLQEEKLRNAPDSHRSRLEKIIRQWRQNPLEADPEAAAAEINMSSSHFRRLFKKFTGQPPMNFINELKLEYAAQALCENPALPLKAVAQQWGFEDIYYFGKLFKRRFGIPPGAYRRTYGFN